MALATPPWRSTAVPRGSLTRQKAPLIDAENLFKQPTPPLAIREAFSASGYVSQDSDFIDYAVKHFPVRLIACNKGDFCCERIRRFTELVNADAAKPIAVFTHHPPFEVTVGPDRLHFETLEIMSRLRQALQQSTRIVSVFSGHVHRAAEGRVGHIPATVTPCIATSLRKGEYPATMQKRPVYQIHRFDPAWGFSTETRIVGDGFASKAVL